MPYYFWMEELVGLILAWMHLLTMMVSGVFFVESGLSRRDALETWQNLSSALTESLFMFEYPDAVYIAFADVEEALSEALRASRD